MTLLIGVWYVTWQRQIYRTTSLLQYHSYIAQYRIVHDPKEMLAYPSILYFNQLTYLDAYQFQAMNGGAPAEHEHGVSLLSVLSHCPVQDMHVAGCHACHAYLKLMTMLKQNL